MEAVGRRKRGAGLPVTSWGSCPWQEAIPAFGGHLLPRSMLVWRGGTCQGPPFSLLPSRGGEWMGRSKGRASGRLETGLRLNFPLSDPTPLSSCIKCGAPSPPLCRGLVVHGPGRVRLRHRPGAGRAPAAPSPSLPGSFPRLESGLGSERPRWCLLPLPAGQPWADGYS